MVNKRIRYEEGQWFAVPLRKGGYGLGLVVRGNYKLKNILGYFFGPRYESVPNSIETRGMTINNALFISWFTDIGIISGSWPLLHSSNLFSRNDWPVPYFQRVSPLTPGKGYLVEYDQDTPVFPSPVRETLVDLVEIKDFPIDQLSGFGAIEIKLSNLLLS